MSLGCSTAILQFVVWRRDVAVNLKGSTTRAAESHLPSTLHPSANSARRATGLGL